MRERMYRNLMTGVGVAVCAVGAPRVACAQQQAPKKVGTTVEIRGEVPTPQVVTVRPRQVPVYSRGILVPAFYDRHFWGAILEPYRIVPPLPSDTSHRPPMAAADSTMTKPPMAAGDTTNAATNALPRGKT
jgi:hypothetical protein